MNDAAKKKAWNRARAIHFHAALKAVSEQVADGMKLGEALAAAARSLNKKVILCGDKSHVLKASPKTMRREWDRWNAGNPDPKTSMARAKACTPEALLLDYKPGCGGRAALPRTLIAEIHRRATMETGGRDKKGQAPLSIVHETLCRDFMDRKPLPGIDYAHYLPGAEFPWSYSTISRHKPSRALRQAGNRGMAAHKAASAYVHMNYTKLRKGELYTLDDVRLDIIVIDEATGKAIEVVCYILMEVGSRSIVAYVIKPVAAIKAEDVDELVAHSLQTPGYGIGRGYVTHILFENGTIACSAATQDVLEGVTEGRIKIHRNMMVGGVRWVGSPRDKASGNAAGKGVIESFNRWLHLALLDLPGQRGNNFANAPANLGYAGAENITKGSVAAAAQELAQFDISTGRRLKLKLPMLYFFELNAAVKAVIDRHNTEAGHAYSGHGRFRQAEVAPGVWKDMEPAPVAAPVELPVFDVPAYPEEVAEAPAAPAAPAVKHYVLKGAAPAQTLSIGQRWAIFNKVWAAVKAVKPETNQFAIMRRVTGKTSLKEMTDEEFLKLAHVLKQISQPS